MTLEEIRIYKLTCSRRMTKVSKRIHTLNCEYNSCVYQWQQLDEQEREIKSMQKYVELAGPIESRAPRDTKEGA